MKKIYLTFDIEPLVNARSFDPTVYNNVLIGGLFIAKELEKRGLKGTFYVSLSKKTRALKTDDFYDGLDALLRTLRSFENISVQPHLHGFDLPLPFPTKTDSFGQYSIEQQIEMLVWGKTFLERYGYDVNSFRPGSYSTSAKYYEALQKSGYAYSSLLNRSDDWVNIDFLSGKVKESSLLVINDVIEYPVTSVKVKSIKGNVENINLSPDFLTIESVERYLEQLDYINVNFHSFSIFTRKFLRENHANVWWENTKYFFWYKPINLFLRSQNLELLDHGTVLKKEFIKWLDFIKKNNHQTFFIGE